MKMLVIKLFQVNDIMKELMTTMKQNNLEKALLCWCQQNTEVPKSCCSVGKVCPWLDIYGVGFIVAIPWG